MGPGASAQPSLALLVVLDEDFGDKSRGMFAQQHDTEFVAKALRCEFSLLCAAEVCA